MTRRKVKGRRVKGIQVKLSKGCTPPSNSEAKKRMTLKI
jgi:hypothetical protein